MFKKLNNQIKSIKIIFLLVHYQFLNFKKVIILIKSFYFTSFIQHLLKVRFL
jgi:hypothetical protein